MALTATQRSDFQADIGIGSDESVFTNDQLDRLYARAGSDYDKAVVYAIDQLLMNAARFNDYTSGMSQEKKSQVFDQLERARRIWARRAGMGLGELEGGVVDLDFMEKAD